MFISFGSMFMLFMGWLVYRRIKFVGKQLIETVKINEKMLAENNAILAENERIMTTDRYEEGVAAGYAKYESEIGTYEQVEAMVHELKRLREEVISLTAGFENIPQ